MPPKSKRASGSKKKGAKDVPVKLDDRDLLRRAEIEIACLQTLLEAKSQEVSASIEKMFEQACGMLGKLGLSLLSTKFYL